jgi:hypothetical protein
MKRPQHTTSARRAPRVVLLSLAFALAGCADLGIPSEPAWTFDDAGAACGAGRSSGTVRADLSIARDERRDERTGCSGAMRGGGARQPAKK